MSKKKLPCILTLCLMFQVAALPKGAKVEIEAIAVIGEIIEETIKE